KQECMNTLIIIITLLVILGIGFIDLFLEVKNYSDKHSFAMDFLEKYTNYIKSKGESDEDYVWLTLRAERMQNQLGSSGVMNYKMAGSLKFISNYPIILNFLPEIRNEFSDGYINKSNFEFTINTVRDTLLRHIGFIEDTKKDYDKQIVNSLAWFRNGVLLIVLFPIKILNQFGLLSNLSYSKVKSSKIFKILASLISIIGFVSSIMSIILGWNEFIKIF
ncbi:hypothetical protein, partial [Stygiobacter electus]